MDAHGAGEEIARTLRPGDILLFHGYGAIPWAIRRFDESDVDHAALVLDPETMAEATASGIRYVPVRSRIDENAFTYVRRLTREADTGTAAGVARSIQDANQGAVHERLVLLAMLGLTRRLPLSEHSLRRFLVALFDRASDVLAILARKGRGILFSSDLVYRAYRGTGDPALALEILFASEKPSSQPDPVRPSALREGVLMDWASTRPDPVPVEARSNASDGLEETVERAEQELAALIAEFERVDAPADPLQPTSPSGAIQDADVSDDDLHRSALRFRDRIVERSFASDPPSGGALEHPWGLFRAVASSVTPGDLRYSPSLKTVTSIRSPRRSPHRVSGGRTSSRLD